MKKMYIVCVSTVLMAVGMAACSPSYKSIKRMQKMEAGISNPTSIEDLELAIKKYDARAMDLVSTQEQEGMWYKMLGTRYLEKKMYGKALESFQKAISFFPDNASLYYYVGMCASYQANAELDYQAAGEVESSIRRMNFLNLAESAYSQALQIEPKYYRAMWGIGVLYLLQLDRSEDSIPYFERFLEVQKRNTDVMMLLAQAYYQNGEFEKAITLYDQVIKLNPTEEKTNLAKENKKTVLDTQYSGK